MAFKKCDTGQTFKCAQIFSISPEVSHNILSLQAVLSTMHLNKLKATRFCYESELSVMGVIVVMQGKLAQNY